MRQLISIIFLTFFSFVAQADPIYIEDNANVIGKEMEESLTELLKDTQAEHGFHVEAIILPHFYQKEPDAVVSAYYQNMLKSNKGTERAAMLLIAIEQNYVKLLTTPNIGQIFNKEVVYDITANVKKQLSEKNYDEMVRIGVAGILHYYQEKYSATKGKHATYRMFNMLFFLAMMGLVVYLIKRRSSAK